MAVEGLSVFIDPLPFFDRIRGWFIQLGEDGNYGRHGNHGGRWEGVTICWNRDGGGILINVIRTWNLGTIP